MPPRSKKNMSVLLFDLKMKRETSLCILDEIIWHKNIANPNDMTRLVLINSTESKNSKKAANIHEVTLDIPYTCDMKPCIENAETADSDWLTGLEISADILSEYRSDSYVFSLQIIFITDLGTPLSEAKSNQAKVLGIIDKLQELDIDLFIVGPKVDYGMTIKSKDDVKTAMQMCKFIESSPETVENEKIVLELASQTNCVVCSAADCVDFLSFVTETIPKQPWQVPLTLEGFEYPTLTTKVMDPTLLPSIRPTEKDTTKWVVPPKNADEEPQVIDDYDVVKAYCFRNKPLALPDDISKLRIEGERMFKLIGFVDAAKIPETFLIGGEAFHVMANPESSKAEAFHQLVQFLAAKNKYSLALRVYNKNFVPKLFILIPQTDTFRLLMLPHPELVAVTCDLSDPPPTIVNKPNDFSTYLENFTNNTMRLSPNCSTGVSYKSFMRKALSFINGGHNMEEPEVKENDVKFSPAFAKIQERLRAKQSTNSDQKDKPATKAESDSDGEDW